MAQDWRDGLRRSEISRQCQVCQYVTESKLLLAAFAEGNRRHIWYFPKTPSTLSIRDFLCTPFLHFLLSFALCPRGRPFPFSASSASQHAFHSTHCRRDEIYGISWYDDIQPPGFITKEYHKDKIDPCPVDQIPHKLCESSRLEILASLSQRAVCIVDWAAEAVQVELENECRSTEKKVWFEGTGEQEESQEDEEAVKRSGDQMRAC